MWWLLKREERAREAEAEREHEQRVWRLATYNAEVARGLVHTWEWAQFMEAEQEWFDREESGRL